MSQRPHKLSPSAINTFLKSPKAYYWHYIARLQPAMLQVATYDHDKIFGIIWAAFVDRFYKGIAEKENLDKSMADWMDQTEGWVPEKARERLTKALTTLSASYYQMFNPTDGCRNPEKSELFLENDRFLGYLDGLSDDGIVHEVKTTSRAPQLNEQLWKVQNSIQVKLYCVLAQAKGHCIEFGFKDPPNQIFRGPVERVSPEKLKQWEQELNTLADKIYALGDDPANFPCHPDGCCLVTKNMVSMCQYQVLCDQGIDEITKTLFKPKTHR